MLSMITSNLVAGVTSSRNWKIRVSQIPCNEGYAGISIESNRCTTRTNTTDWSIAAPPGCLQYFTGYTGVLKSFNFFFDARGSSTARQLSYQDYTICIRQENVSSLDICSWFIFRGGPTDLLILLFQNFCQMQYSVCPDPVNTPGLGFSISGALIAGDNTVASGTDAACTTDYLMIPCGSDIVGQTTNSDASVCATRMCGSAFNSVNARTLSTPVYSKLSSTNDIVSIHPAVIVNDVWRALFLLQRNPFRSSCVTSPTDWKPHKAIKEI